MKLYRSRNDNHGLHIYLSPKAAPIHHWCLQDAMGRRRREDNKAMILTDAIEGKTEIDLERAKRAYERARARIEKKDEVTNLKRAQLALERAVNRINVYGG